MENSRVIGVRHKDIAEAVVVESYIAPTNFEMNGQLVNKGDWVLVSRIDDADHWKAVKSGEFNSYSVAGWALKKPV